jgi:hypothetical protein
MAEYNTQGWLFLETKTFGSMTSFKPLTMMIGI